MKFLKRTSCSFLPRYGTNGWKLHMHCKVIPSTPLRNEASGYVYSDQMYNARIVRYSFGLGMSIALLARAEELTPGSRSKWPRIWLCH